MLKKLTASILIVCQLVTPVAANAGIDTLLNDVFKTVLDNFPVNTPTTESQPEKTVISDMLKRGNKEILVFSDGDPLVYDPGNKAQSENQYQQYKQVRQMVLDKKQLDFEDLVKLSNAIRPYMSYLENLERVKNGGNLTLPPGASVNLELKTFCADPGISEPAFGDDLQIVDSSAIVPNKAKKLYKALLNYSLNRPEERLFVQQQIHDIKVIQKAPSYLLGNVNPEKRKFFDKIMPNGGNEYAQYVKWAKAQADAGKSREPETLQESVAKWNPESNLNGLKFKAKDTEGAAKALAEVKNDTNSPITMAPTNLAAIPATPTRQRLAVAGIGNIYSNLVPVFDPTHQKLVEALLTDFKEIAGQVVSKVDARRVAEFALERNALSPFVKNMLSTTPLVGTAIAAWELYSGRNFFTSRELSPAEKMLSALNLVPSTGLIAKTVGAAALPMLEKFAKASNTTQVVGGLMTAETSEYYSGKLYGTHIDNQVMEYLAQDAMTAYRNDPSTPAAARKLIPA